MTSSFDITVSLNWWRVQVRPVGRMLSNVIVFINKLLVEFPFP